MTSLSFSKLVDMFKNMKADAVPRAPRPRATQRQEDQLRPNGTDQRAQDNLEDEEEIVIEPEELKKDKKKKKSKSNVNVEDTEDFNLDGEEKNGSSSTAHIQATGTVYNIMNSKHVRLGNDFYFGPVAQSSGTNSETTNKQKKPQEEQIEKDNLISLLIEAKIKPDHDYMDYISKNLGKNWHSFFRALKFSQGRIETAEINAMGYDISEARYKLLLDWVNNDDDGSLGRLTTVLWEEGERCIVKELSVMYKKTKK